MPNISSLGLGQLIQPGSLNSNLLTGTANATLTPAQINNSSAQISAQQVSETLLPLLVNLITTVLKTAMGSLAGLNSSTSNAAVSTAAASSTQGGALANGQRPTIAVIDHFSPDNTGYRHGPEMVDQIRQELIRKLGPEAANQIKIELYEHDNTAAGIQRALQQINQKAAQGVPYTVNMSFTTNDTIAQQIAPYIQQGSALGVDFNAAAGNKGPSVVSGLSKLSGIDIVGINDAISGRGTVLVDKSLLSRTFTSHGTAVETASNLVNFLRTGRFDAVA